MATAHLLHTRGPPEFTMYDVTTIHWKKQKKRKINCFLIKWLKNNKDFWGKSEHGGDKTVHDVSNLVNFSLYWCQGDPFYGADCCVGKYDYHLSYFDFQPHPLFKVSLSVWHVSLHLYLVYHNYSSSLVWNTFIIVWLLIIILAPLAAQF